LKSNLSEIWGKKYPISRRIVCEYLFLEMVKICSCYTKKRMRKNLKHFHEKFCNINFERNAKNSLKIEKCQKKRALFIEKRALKLKINLFLL